MIQAWVPIDTLESLADLPEVRYNRPPDYGVPNTGSVTTEGDAKLGLDDVRQQFGVNGSGIRVGVISTGLKGLEQSIALGDLPQTTFHCQDFFLTIRLRPNGPCLSGERLVETSGGITGRPFPSGGDLAPDGEGTAMLEIVHDLAPGAELWFANANPITTVNLFNAAVFLAANVDVLVSDIGFHGFFPDGQNTISQAVAQIINNTTNTARAYIQAAGNEADLHYSGLYVSSGINDGFGDFHLFSANSETTGPGTSFLNRITVPPLGSGSIVLSWNDPAGASTNDYDLLRFDCASLIFIDESNDLQIGFTEPREVLPFTNFSSSSVDVCYSIQNFLNFAAPRTLNVTFIGNVMSSSHQFNTISKSLLAPADATGDLIAVGAVNFLSPDTIEEFSSRGPTFDGREKPDVVATDGVTVTGAGGFPVNCCKFFGTSAAAPHVAGLAVLLLELDPTLTLSGLKFVLKQNTDSLGDGNIFGAGRINGLAAAQSRVFTDDPLASQVTLVKAVHITELRQAINNLMLRNGLSTFAFTNSTLTSGVTPIKAVHLTELRTALNEVFDALGQTRPTYTDPTITAGQTVIKKVHIEEIRSAVRTVESLSVG